MKILLAATGADMASGANKCLLELAERLPYFGVDVLVTIPQHGNIEEHLIRKKIAYKFIHEYHSWYTSEKHKKNQFFLKHILNYKAFFQMRRLIKKEKIDIVHENALTAYVAAWAAESLCIPVVWHMREFMEEDLNITFFNKEYSIQKINKAMYLIAISKAVANKWKRIFSPPIEVVYDGVAVDDYYISSRDRDVSDVINIIIYGRIAESKGQLFFFKGINRLKKIIDRKIQCFWAGQIEDREYYNKIISYINKNEMDEYVKYLGEVSNIKSILKDMDVVCVCSSQEGFGRVTVEAMLAGCIVLGANTGATKELIFDGKNGYLYEANDIIDFSDKLKNIMINLKQNRKMAKKAQLEAYNNYSINNNIKKVIEIYNRAIENKRGL